MTLNEYIDNPYRSSAVSVQARDAMKQSYADKLDKLFLREGRDTFQTKYFKSKSSWFFYISIPSETVMNFKYDVLIEFKDAEKSNTLYDCEVKFFCNDPSFMYNAYTYNKNNLLITNLKSKLPKEALTIKPTRNPNYIVPYNKQIYFAYLLSKRYGLLTKSMFDIYGIPYNKTNVLNMIPHTSIKIEQRTKLADEIKRAEKKVDNDKNLSRIDSEHSKNIKIQQKVNTVSNINKTKKVNTISKIAKTPKNSNIKRIGKKGNKV